ncbi:hypothetical protein AYI68_g6576 [Smittium mucronatum]|uniref:Uncharacterized protein n=1 Tax=Smittium mucronatum TaxID=133383 RepID=A0A1R0GL97_9FUNG|nr:hypothetical protein AYI68_g8306 [Smittium mucronatum]OLY79356.1 hypothetical protein AYI68_g6576 [Smittium mucronatum]
MAFHIVGSGFTNQLDSSHGRNNRLKPYRGLGPEFKESPSKVYARSSITGSPSKSIYGSKSLPIPETLVEIDNELSLSLSSSTFIQDSAFSENPQI